MEGGFRNYNSRFRNYEYEYEEANHGSWTEEAAECPVESPPSTVAAFSDLMKLPSPSPSSRKRSKRSLHKRVVSIPIKDSEGSRLKGEGAPPSDSWAWRKYGQKPIKGSPYPRGYYRCSSSKGCPARKQVERSHDDPTLLVITYSSEHNHPWPAPRNNHHHPSAAASDTSAAAAVASPDDLEKPDFVSAGTPEHDPEVPEPEEKLMSEEPSPILPPPPPPVDEFSWFTDMETTSSALLESPFFSESTDKNNNVGRDAADMAMFIPMPPLGEDDELLFADLGELPECSVVFRHRDVGTQVQIC